jgi:hypothetical protein
VEGGKPPPPIFFSPKNSFFFVTNIIWDIEMDALRRSSRISRKDRIRNVSIRQQIGLEETIIKEIEKNRLTWYGHVQRMAEGRLPKIALNWMPKQKRAREDRRKT